MKAQKFWSLLITVIGLFVYALFITPFIASAQAKGHSESKFTLKAKKINPNLVKLYLTIEVNNEKVILTAIGDNANGVLGIVRVYRKNIVGFIKSQSKDTDLEILGFPKNTTKQASDQTILLAKRIGNSFQYFTLIDDAQAKKVFSVFDQLLFRMAIPYAKNQIVSPMDYTQPQAIEILTFDCPIEWLWTNDDPAPFNKTG